ncbi:15678_t:CDS:2 [Funneliformis caledonium]|uniref:15678_t:CDS:1 n=1 Tax=Funneliformis caledonium TaxID=1117310 RepID=A0A9N9HAK4_9GLOM|nr:15678_t:CDS:2 [Funneliformis caledonium]
MFKRNNLKYISLALATLFCFHWVLTVFHPSSSFSKPWTGLLEPEINGEVLIPSQHAKQIGKAKACFVILIRNHDLHEFRWTMRQLEDRFNKKYNYPYVFLNDVPFTEEFKKLSSALTNAKTEYGLIPTEHWSVPKDIDMDLVNKNMAKMKEEDVIYGDSLPYRHMCRFESGFFYRHELLDKYDFYWRVEPGVQFFCDIDFDPFMYLKENDIKYTFTVSLYEYQKTIPTLWDSVKEFMKKYPQYIEKDNSIEFISDDNGETYNLCHFWSNFEIADLNFLRSEAYMKFFDFLDKKGGFFYERWGDAPVHSIAAALFLKKHQIHFFNEIGYKHDPFMHCPAEETLQMKCHCDPDESFDYKGYSCTGKFLP